MNSNPGEQTNPSTCAVAMVAACPFPSSQGSQVLIRQLSEALCRRGHEVHLVCYHFGEDISLPKDGRLYIHRIPYPPVYRKFRAGPSPQKPLLDLLMAVRLACLIRRYRLQVIHAHNYEGLLIGLAVRAVFKTPLIFHSHNALSAELPSYYKRPFVQRQAGRLARLIDRYAPRRADRVIALSGGLERFFMEHDVERRRLVLLPPGIDLAAWSVEPDTDDLRSAEVIERLDHWLAANGSGARRVAVYAGNLDGYQNLPFMFRAFARVRRELEDALLVVVTRSDPAPDQRLVRKLDVGDAVTFVEHTDFNTVRQVFRRSKVALCPRTSWCGFPIKLLNYMAAGLPVVACRGGAGPVEHESTGLLSENGDEAEFAGHLVQLLRNPSQAESLGQNGARRVTACYRWEDLVKQVEDLYRGLIHPAPPGGTSPPNTIKGNDILIR